MKPYDLWRRMIVGKVYSKKVVTTRVNTVFAVGQLTESEYTELIGLINEKYEVTA